VWLHRPARFDGWILYASHSPVAHAARGLVIGAMYDASGARVASVVQEGLVRVPK
jgi:acyl-CoA thioesterase-2